MACCWLRFAAALAFGVVAVDGTASAQEASADLGFTAASASASSSLVTVNADVINSGPSAAEAPVITYALPAGLTFARGGVATVDTCAVDAPARVVTCTWPSPPADPGVSTSAFLALTNTGLPTGSEVSIELQISSPTPDPNTSNNTVAVTVTLVGDPVPTVPGGASADLAVTAEQPSAGLQPGTVAFPWGLTNLGVAPARDVVVTFTIPVGARFGSGDVATSPCTAGPATGPVSCPFGPPLVPSATISASLVLDIADIPAGTRLTVQASVAASTADPNPANNVITSTFQLPGGAPPMTMPPRLVPTGGRPISLHFAAVLLTIGVALVAASRSATRRPSTSASMLSRETPPQEPTRQPEPRRRTRALGPWRCGSS